LSDSCVFILLFSCKSMINVPSTISYDFVNPEGINQVHVGDFQKIELFDNDYLLVMPAFFRKFNELNNSLIVTVRLPKKFGLTKHVSVRSKNFGDVPAIKTETASWPSEFDEVFFIKKINSVQSQVELDAITNDTIEVKIGDNTSFLFSLNH
ncbi:hypothetical protein MNBD_BACTEROID03-672, partial [hydrothermal vent metagenome]